MLRSLLLLAAAVLAAAPALAQTCTTEWAAPASGAWTSPGAWTNGVPGASSVACITQPGTYTVALATNTDVTVAGLVVGGASGTQTLVSGESTYVRLRISGDGRIGPNGRLHIRDGSISGVDGLWLGGTLLVEGEVAVYDFAAFLSDGGTLDVAPGGRLRVEAPTTTTVGGLSATLRLRGTWEGGCGAATCNVNARLDAEGGTLRVLAGRFDFRGGGAVDGLVLDVPAGRELLFRADGSVPAPQYVVEGTVSGAPEGAVQWAAVEVAAGPAGATLAVGGTGFQLVGSAFLTSAGGEFVNTGTLLRPATTSNFSGIRGAVVRNQGVISVPSSFSLLGGAVLRNEPGGVVDLVAGGSLGGDGRLENAGLLRRRGAEGAFTFEPGMLRSLPGSEIRVETSRLDLRAPGSEVLPAGATLTGTGRVFTPATLEVEGTVSPGTDAQPVATLDVQSYYRAAATGSARLVVDVAAGGQSDLVDVLAAPGTGQLVRLGGTLVVRVAPGYVPQLGDTFTVVRSAALVEGQFAEVVTEGAPAGVGFAAEVVADPGGGQRVVLRAFDTVDADDGPEAALVLAVAPNPSAGAATVRLRAPAAGGAAVRVVDALGREVARLHDGPLVAGDHGWDVPRHLPAGVYAVEARLDGARRTARLTVVR